MKIKTLNLLWFSASSTTKKVIELIANELDIEERDEYDIANRHLMSDNNLDSNDLLLIGMPVYGGRVPHVAISSLLKLKGNNTPAIIVCVYGNRNYDDTLLEMKTIISKNGFKVIAAGAFIAQHSLFPKIGANRPDKRDKDKIIEFAQESKNILSKIRNTDSIEDIFVKGNIPFKKKKKVPFLPKTNSGKCSKCRICYEACPVSAISYRNPANVEKSCISCARCITVCPENARYFGGLLYYFVEKNFAIAYHSRKKPELFFSNIKE